MKRENKIALLINEITGINVYKNTRKSEYVEYRSLYNYILWKVMKKSLTWIRNHYKENGKNYDHATVIHSLKMFDIYKKYNKNIMPLFNELCQFNDTVLEEIAFIDTTLQNMNKDEVKKVSKLVNELLIQNYKNEASENTEVQAERVEAES